MIDKTTPIKTVTVDGVAIPLYQPSADTATYYTGSTAPASSLGSNGDLYLKLG